jgi:hypothetical protein
MSRVVVIAILALAGAVAFIVMRPEYIFAANTPSGGDMGAHVLVPAFLRDVLLPSGRFMGWSMDWYAGFPALYFYFPLPALTIVVLDVLLPYGVAFKLVTVAGLVALPAASYYFARGMGFSRPVSLIGGVSGFTFAFMESFSIYGGNTLSTLAGEYSFSWSFALSLVYLGMVTRNTRQGRGFTAGPAIMLALTALSHLITTLVVVLASLPLLLRKRGPAAVAGAWGLGFGLAAFWALPLLLRVGYTTDMRWYPVTDLEAVFPREIWPVMLLAAGGFAWAIARRYLVGPALALIAFPIAGFYLIQYFDFRKLYNARLLPYWYYTAFLFAGLFVGMALVAAVRRLRSDPRLLWSVTGAAAVFFLVAGALGVQKAPAWAKWNYTGYEGKDAYPEYERLMQTLDELPPGRVMWEANSELNRYGTPMALMLTGYWSEGHPSMEGLLFESSVTTQFHFLNAAEVSQRPSNPIPGLNYHRLDFERATAHLAVYGVSYYVSFTDEATEAASQAGLEVLAEPEPFTVFALPPSPMVEVAAFEPAVWAGEATFHDAALEWYDDISRLDRWVVEGGPAEWPRITEITRSDSRDRITAPGEITDLDVGHHHVSFRTEAIGVPHLVKVSYFPNWRADGAEGPWRAAPSLMVVVPTQEEVTLEFKNTAGEYLGLGLSLVSAAGVAAWWAVGRRRRRERRSRSSIPPEIPADLQQADHGAGHAGQE